MLGYVYPLKATYAMFQYPVALSCTHIYNYLLYSTYFLFIFSCISISPLLLASGRLANSSCRDGEMKKWNRHILFALFTFSYVASHKSHVIFPPHAAYYEYVKLSAAELPLLAMPQPCVLAVWLHERQ